MIFRKSHLGMIVENCCTFGFYLNINCGTIFKLFGTVRNAFCWWVQLLETAQTGAQGKTKLEDPRWVFGLGINTQS